MVRCTFTCDRQAEVRRELRCKLAKNLRCKLHAHAGSIIRSRSVQKVVVRLSGRRPRKLHDKKRRAAALDVRLNAPVRKVSYCFSFSTTPAVIAAVEIPLTRYSRTAAA